MRFERRPSRCRAGVGLLAAAGGGGGTAASPPLPGGTEAGTGDEGADHRQGGRPRQQREQCEGGEGADGESAQRATAGRSFF